MVVTRKFISLIIIALSVGVNLTYGQDIYKKHGVEFVEPSPNSMSILDVVHQPVNYYTGAPEISIPLTQLKGRTLEMPVSLSYDASGNKVNEMASWVGLGWALNTGGMITRVVMDVPDEDVDGYFTTRTKLNSFLTENPSTRKSNLYNFEDGDWDNEPDMFYINVPGFSGKFVFDTNGDPLMIPDNDYVLEPAIGPNALHSYWKLVSPNGTEYYFGETSNSTETTVETRDQYDYKNELKETKAHTFISTWYLSRVVNNKGQDEFNLTYYLGFNTTYTDDYDIVTTAPASTVADVNKKQKLTTTVTIQSPKYLDEITSIHGKLNFQTTAGYRTDLASAKSLEKVTLEGSGPWHSYSLSYGYFQSGSDVSTQRLKLLSVQEDGLPAYTFGYYSTHNLPQRNTHQIDAWGYYNSSTTDKSSAYYPSGSDRSVDINRVKASVLTKITYPTGGYKQFTYEPNKYRLNGIDKTGGGIRVASIKLHDGLLAANDIVTNYSYEASAGVSSGQLNYAVREYQNPFYGNHSIVYASAETVFKTRHVTLVGPGYPFPFDIHFSRPLNYMPQRPIGYSRIVVSNTGNGSSEYIFSDYSSRGDVTSNKYDLMTLNPETSEKYPIIPDNSRDWERGLLLEESIRDNAGRLVKQTINTYSHGVKRNSAKSKAIFSFAPSIDIYQPENYTSIGIHETESMRSELLSTEERVFDQVDWSGNYFETKVEYEHGTHLQVSKKKTTNSQGDIDIVEYIYPMDYDTDATVPGDPGSCATQLSACQQIQDDDDPTNDCNAMYQICLAGTTYPLDAFSTVIKAMQDKNMIAIPIEVISKVKKGLNTGTISSSLTEYSLVAGMVVPLSVHESNYNGSSFTSSKISSTGNFEKHSSYEKRVNFNEYSSYGMLESLSKEGGDYRLRYLYAYDGAIPIAEIKNSARKADVAYTSFETSENGGWSFNGFGLSLFTSRNNQIVTDAMTGGNVYFLSTGFGNITKSSLEADKRYVVSFWVKNGGSTVTINGSASPTNITARDFTLHMKEITGVTSVTLQSSGAYIDELRIHPVGSTMTTYTYDRQKGITSISTPNNSIQYFEYDSNFRLKAIMDIDWNYLSVFDYKYQIEAQNTGN